MTTGYEHPTLKMYVTAEQRDRAENWLQEAYADGRVEPREFDYRMGQVLGAVTRKDLNEAFYGLVPVAATSQALGIHPAYQPLVRPELRQQAGRGVAAAAHFSVFFVWLLGPGLVYAASPAGSYARREAAKAFNFQVISTVLILGDMLLGAVTGADAFGWIFGAMVVSWFVLTVVGGAKALQGENWKNPVSRVDRLKLLAE